MFTARFEEAIQSLKQGKLSKCKQILEDLILYDPTNPAILFNLGLCYADLNELDAAIRTLNKTVDYDPLNSDALAALGLACARNHDFDNAERCLKKSIALNPENPCVLRQFGALFLQKQKYDKAFYYLKQSFELQPNEPQTLFGLARAYEFFGDHQNADDYYKAVLDANAPDKIKELARTARTRLAQPSFQNTAFRPDAMLYLISALEYFAEKSKIEIQEVTFEIGWLNRCRLDINSPDQQYTLKSMPGKFSGLQLVCFMVVGFQKIDPAQDLGIDLSREYAAALAIHNYQNDK